MKDCARAAARFGVKTVTGFTGPSIWHSIYPFPPTSQANWDKGFADFAAGWTPIPAVLDEIEVSFGEARRFGGFRSVGRGLVDFEQIIVALDGIGYQGLLSVEWEGGRRDRVHGATVSAAFCKRLDLTSNHLLSSSTPHSRKSKQGKPI